MSLHLAIVARYLSHSCLLKFGKGAPGLITPEKKGFRSQNNKHNLHSADISSMTFKYIKLDKIS